MPSWTELLQHAEPEQHLVQLYGNDDQFLAANVGRYLSEGLRRGNGLLLVATAEHAEAIIHHMQDESGRMEDAIREGRFVTLDAQATLPRLMVGGQPDRDLFESVVGGVLRKVQARAAGAGSRIWRAGRSPLVRGADGRGNSTRGVLE